MRFEFASAGRIVFGPGTMAEAARSAVCFGQRVLIVTGRTPSRSLKLNEMLEQEGMARWTISIGGEPTTDDVLTGAALAREERIDVIAGFGGGSAIDAAKAIAALAMNEGDLLDYLEVIGQGRPLRCACLPVIAIPTTAGTGSEVTRNAVLVSPTHRLKVSLRSPAMLPRVAVVDPELTSDLPAAITAATGLDALTQLIEPYVSSRANPLTDAICVKGIRRAARSLRRVFENGRDASARQDMALASLCGGLALANAGLGAVHGFAAPIGGMFPAPHGAVCAALLPHVMQVNVRALMKRSPESDSLRRYKEIAQLVTRRQDAGADDGMRWVAQLCSALAIPPLRSYGITSEDLPDLVEKAAKASSMKGNPIALTADELEEIVSAAL